ncbi:MAG: tyrosine-type recombinase/integrase [bacterium]
MTINFYLNYDKRTPNPEKTIYVYIRDRGNTIAMNTGERINPKYWNITKQEIKKGHTGSPELNERLTTIKKDIQKIHRDLLNDNSLATFSDFKEKIKLYFKKDEPKLKSFFDVYEMFLELRKSELSTEMIKKFITLRNHLQNYSNFSKSEISFDKIDLLFHDLFSNYLLNEKKMTNNSIYKLFSMLKTLLYWCNDRNINVNPIFKKFQSRQNKIDIIYLSEKELMKIYYLNLSKNKSLENVRDVFCFACFTGQRFSDVSGIKKSDIKSNLWHLRTQKTQDIIKIPLNDFAIEILEKYRNNEKPLPIISHQKTNEHLKELCKIANIDESITIVKYSGAERIEKTFKKYELIATHTARRTFVTLSLEKGMRPETVMEITGHKDYKTFKKYIKISTKVKQVEMNNIWKKEPILKISKVG